MNNLNKKQIIFSEHFLKQGKLSEKKPKSSMSDAAVTDSGLSVPGEVYLSTHASASSSRKVIFQNY